MVTQGGRFGGSTPEITYRTDLVGKVMVNEDVDIFAATEAVSSTAIEHPEWDMDGERHTWDQWDRGYWATLKQPPSFD